MREKLVLLIALCFAVGLVSQDDRKQELQRQKVQLQDEIELANRILEEPAEQRILLR
ncbi:MAG: hypothetical protein U5L96_15505 [Owenweeksia sp.]|nr:hypothetical protein [Owenweeksia sp.]